MNNKLHYDFIERVGYCVDSFRTNAYNRFLAKVAPGATICDLGTGTGVLSYLAVQHGAKKVYAVERDANTLKNASMVLWDSPNIELIHDDAATFKIPSDVDICIHEIFGNCIFDEGLLKIISNVDAQGFSDKLFPRKVDIFSYEHISISRALHKFDQNSYDSHVQDFLKLLHDTWRGCISEAIGLQKVKDYIPDQYIEHPPEYSWDITKKQELIVPEHVKRLLLSNKQIGWRAYLSDDIWVDNIPRKCQSWTPIRRFKKNPGELLSYFIRQLI